jgi:hypothetical protein
MPRKNPAEEERKKSEERLSSLRQWVIRQIIFPAMNIENERP